MPLPVTAQTTACRRADAVEQAQTVMHQEQL